MIKKLMVAIVAIATFSGFAVAGGDITPAYDNDTTSGAESGFVDVRDGVYLGLGLGSVWNYTDGNFDLTDDTDESVVDPFMQAILGYEFYKYDIFAASAELRLGSSFDGDDIDTTVFTGYLKGHLDVVDDFGVYGLVGASHLRWNIGDYSANENAFSWGLGVDYKLTKNLSAFAEYQFLMWNKDVDGAKDVNTDVALIGVTYRF
jgi:opacity protein-like surface antigen